MRKVISTLIAVLAAVGLISCTVNTDNNHGFEEEEFDVNFGAASSAEIHAGCEFAIMATCTRDGVQDTPMSANSVARFKAVEDGSSVRLVPVTEADRVITCANDHNYSFIAISPYSDQIKNAASIPVEVPSVQSFEDGVISAMPMFAEAKPSNVTPDITLDFKSIFSIIEFSYPSDPIMEDESAVLKSLEFKGKNVQIVLTDNGSFNALTKTFTRGSKANSQSVTIDFGSNGYKVPAEGGKVMMAVAPFEVPEGGMQMIFTDMEGTSNTMDVYSKESDAGTKVSGGETASVQVSRIDDGIVPVVFPVYFPIGFAPDQIDADNKSTSTSVYSHASVQPTWRPSSNKADDGIYIYNLLPEKGVFVSKSQPVATMKWHWVNDFSQDGSVACPYNPAGRKCAPFIEFTGGTKGSATLIAGPGVKGIWTGDYFEFDLPVKKFKAGTSVKFTFAVCTKNGPTFWEVKYKDGDEWKSTAVDNLPAFEGSDVKMRATWAIPYNSAPKMETVMTFTKAIPSGHLLVRLVCVDGGTISTGLNAVVTGRTYSFADSTNSFSDSPFYLCEKSAERNPDKTPDLWDKAIVDQTKTISFTIL